MSDHIPDYPEHRFRGSDEIGIHDHHSMALVDAIPQIVWTASPDGVVDYYNRHWVEYTGLTAEQTNADGWASVLHPDDVPKCVSAWTHACQTGVPYELEHRLKRAADGAYRWHLGRALPARDTQNNIVKWFGTCTDIQDQKDAYDLVANKALERTADLAAANSNLIREIEERKLISETQQRDTVRLNEIITTQCQLAEAQLDLEAFFKLVVYRMDTLTPATGSAVELLDAEDIVYRAGSGIAAAHIGLRLGLHGSLSGLCIKSREVLRSDDTENDPRVDRDACQRLGIRSMVVAPLFHEGKAVGVLKAMAAHPYAFGGRDMQTLQLMAGLVGAAIAHQTAFDAKQSLLNELSGAVENIKTSERRTRTVIESAYDAFVAIDANGNITDWNRQAEMTFGWTHAEVVGQPVSQIIIPERFRAAHLAGMKHFDTTGEGPVLNKRIELQGLRRDNHEFPVELTINVIKHGDTHEFFAFLHDITDRKKAEERLLQMAQYDHLTGLPNRRLFIDRLVHAMERAKRTKKQLALMYIDIDHFKEINDTFGHATGDALLQEVARRLVRSTRSMDTVARLGGDEFVVIMEEIQDPADSVVITEKITHNVREEIRIDAHVLNVTVSLGGVFYRDEEISEQVLIDLADQSLYKAKSAGRNTGVWINQGERFSDGI